jgi:glycosyltransferase involved in cell wall biosynthesis
MFSRVSILIPCYNAERWIYQAIESALNQTYFDKEVIVIDDGSTDKSLEIIKSFGNKIYWESTSNQGGNVARNRLIQLSTGKWLQYLDADDYLLPNKVEKQINFMAKVPQADVIYSPSIFEYYRDGKSWQEVLPIPAPHDPWILLARWYLPQTGSPLWRKQAILDVGGWKDDQPCCQEHELYLRLLMARKRFEYFPKSGSIYRQWSESTVCKRNLTEIHYQRLAIEEKIEHYLKTRGELNQLRRNAINQARFECARMIWLYNKQWATEVISQIHRNSSNFMPSGKAAPVIYRFAYKLFGFNMAEKLAQYKRNVNIKSTPKFS